MAFSGEHIDDEWLGGIACSFPHLPDLLDALLRALIAHARPRSAAICLHGVGAMVASCHGAEIVSDWLSEPGQVPHASVLSGGGLRLAIGYAGSELGGLEIDMATPLSAGDPLHASLCRFAHHCGLLIQRYAVRQWSEQRLGRSLLLVGMSRPLRALERFLEIAARGDLPVLLRGEFGTEKAQLAAAIHCSGAQSSGPFVQVECAEPEGPPHRWIERAEGGTLFLSGVDELDERLQKQLPQYLPSRLDQWLPAGQQPSLRLIASTTEDLPARARDGRFSRALLAELDFLSVAVPPLRERAGDIEALICHVLERNGYRPDEKRSEALVELCKAHDWPENLYELERVIARLAVMTEGRRIERRDVCRHAPAIVPDGLEEGDGDDEPVATGDAERWVRAAIEGEGPALAGLHEALVRALVHLGRHYAEPLALSRLAWHANVSPSHLGFLFRSAIGMPFKTLLSHVRIRKAREMLAEDERRNITDVALSVGFSDLSHFEKSFRRIVGQSPREYRRGLPRPESAGAVRAAPRQVWPRSV